MFGNSSHKLPPIPSYKHARAYFTSTRKPPRSKKWADHQRPLKDVSSTHYRIEEHNNGEYYDLVNYNTTLARFHRPDAEGNELREYLYHHSTVSRDFLRWVALVHGFTEKTTTSGRQVIMPIAGKNMPGSQFSCQAWFTPSGQLIVEKSQHTRLFRKVSSDYDKSKRAALKLRFTPLLTLAAMRLPEMAADVEFDYYLVGAFRSRSLKYAQRTSIAHLRTCLEQDRDPEQSGIDAFMGLAKDVFDKIASDRAAEKGLLKWDTTVRNAYDQIEPIDESTLINALWRKLTMMFDLNTTTGRKEYPQFPAIDEIVLSNCTTNGND